MSKINKLLRNPGEFIRDYFIKKFPPSYGGYKITYKDRVCADYLDSNLVLNDVSDDIDAVYTWVNDQDENWKQKKQYYCNIALKNKDNMFPESICEQRFRNHNEVEFSVKSIKKFAPWIRKIFIITDGQIPKFDNYEKIIIIDHKDIIEKIFLPTFNSHVIEANLHKIPGLSKRFIYFNDDVFLAKKLQKQHFFRNNGLASLFLADRKISIQQKKGVITPTLQASLNSIKLIKSYYNNIKIDRPLVHTYIPLNKQIFEFCYNKFLYDINSFSINKFRSKNDLNLATFLVPWIMYLHGASFENIDICYYMNINSASFFNDMENLKQIIGTSSAPHSFCLNDVETANKFDNKNKLHIEDIFD